MEVLIYTDDDRVPKKNVSNVYQKRQKTGQQRWRPLGIEKFGYFDVLYLCTD